MVLKLTSETSLGCWGQAEPPGPDIAFLVTRLLPLLKVFSLKAFALVLCLSNKELASSTVGSGNALGVCAGALELCASRL